MAHINHADIPSLWAYEGGDLSIEECRNFFTQRWPSLDIECTGDSTIQVSASQMPRLMRVFIACLMIPPVKTKAGLPKEVVRDIRARAKISGIRLVFEVGGVRIYTLSGDGWTDSPIYLGA